MSYALNLARTILPRLIDCPCCNGHGDHELGALLNGHDTLVPERTVECAQCEGEGFLRACPSCRDGVREDGEYCVACDAWGYAKIQCEGEPQ